MGWLKQQKCCLRFDGGEQQPADIATSGSEDYARFWREIKWITQATMRDQLGHGGVLNKLLRMVWSFVVTAGNFWVAKPKR